MRKPNNKELKDIKRYAYGRLCWWSEDIAKAKAIVVARIKEDRANPDKRDPEVLKKDLRKAGRIIAKRYREDAQTIRAIWRNPSNYRNILKQCIIGRYISTPEGRTKLAESMTQPLRCGGKDYINGVGYTKYGGKMLTDAECEILRKRNNGSVVDLGHSYHCPECYDPRTHQIIPGCVHCAGTGDSEWYRNLLRTHVPNKGTWKPSEA